MRHEHKGFTLIELLVVVAIISLLVVMLLPAIQHAIAMAKKAACMNNLRSVNSAAALYADGNTNALPVIDPEYTNPEESIPDDGPTDVPFGEDGEDWVFLGQNVMQNVWLLVSEDLITPEVFHCPADDRYKSRERSAIEASDDFPRDFGWYSPDNYSYGMHWSYDGNGTDINPARLNAGLPSAFVTFADRNPGGAVGEGPGEFAPSNHKRLGTAYLTAVGSVGFRKKLTDSRCGKSGDDIYTVQSPDGSNSDQISAMPVSRTDTYICLPEGD